MKTGVKSLIIVLLTLLSVSKSMGQDWPRLNITVKQGFNASSASIYVELIMPDYIMAVDILKKSFKENGFKIVDDKNKADLILSMNYKDRSDMGCSGGRVMKKLEGKISGAKGMGETMVIFNFTQTGFEGKCTPEVFSALAKKIKADMLKK